MSASADNAPWDRMAGRRQVHRCHHLPDDPDLARDYPNGAYDVDLYDYWGSRVTVAEFATFAEAQAFADAFDPMEHWSEYLLPTVRRCAPAPVGQKPGAAA